MNKNEFFPNLHLIIPSHYTNLNIWKRNNCILTVQNNVTNNFNGGANDSDVKKMNK